MCCNIDTPIQSKIYVLMHLSYLCRNKLILQKLRFMISVFYKLDSAIVGTGKLSLGSSIICTTNLSFKMMFLAQDFFHLN